MARSTITAAEEAVAELFREQDCLDVRGATRERIARHFQEIRDEIDHAEDVIITTEEDIVEAGRQYRPAAERSAK